MNDLSFAHISSLAEIRGKNWWRSRRAGSCSARQLAHFANLPTSLIVKRETCL